MIIYNIEQGSEAWFTARCGRVTSTRFKDLMAGESTDTYKKLVTNIVCEMITGKMEETYSNALMEHGIETEPIARMEYESIFDIEVKQVGFITPDEDHKYHDWIGISPDGLLPDEGIIEIKCPLARTHLEYIESGKLPSEYRYQVQGQLFVTGFKYCHFMSFVENMKPFIIPVLPDVDLFLQFEKRLDLLREHIQNKLSLYKQYQYLDNE
jgi:putative phage-type endonuclease